MSNMFFNINSNFKVAADSLMLLRNQPEELLGHLPTDSMAVVNGDRLVVADFRVIPTDSIDTLWVAVARDQETIGWVRCNTLLEAVTPDDPISEFINFFSSSHIFLTIVLCVFTISTLVIRKIMRRRDYLIHVNDIPSFYPKALVVTVAAAATLYGCIQLFATDQWRWFYFHPTLNPFHQPPLLMMFLLSFWTIIILYIATADDVARQLPQSKTWVYMAGLTCFCAILYIVFSITTQYYIGIPLLFIYIIFVINSCRDKK